MEDQNYLKSINSHLKSINGWVTFMGVITLIGVIVSVFLGFFYYITLA